MSAIARLTPQMAQYQRCFSDGGEVNWQPYFIFFHPFGYTSETVNTDSHGFRYTEAGAARFSVADAPCAGPVRLIAGSSTVFGIGASSDAHTLAARLTLVDPQGRRWLNFGGRSFNSAQELILFTLERHLLPEVDEIVLFSGFNDLGLARLPERYQTPSGAFFMANRYEALMSEPEKSVGWRSLFRKDTAPDVSAPDAPSDVPSLEAQMARGAGLTLRHLAGWKAMADAMGARLTFMLQPLANWVRQTGCTEEEALFAELEDRGGFSAAYGDILTSETHTAYAARLRQGVEALGCAFIDFAPHLAAALEASDWVFVDRIHFTDHGHDLAARILLESLDQKGRQQ